MSNIKNILFDFGGVLLNVDYHKTIEAFKELGIPHFEQMYSQATADPVFEKLETGKISETEFYKTMQQASTIDITPQQIQNAWNAMLLDFRKESLAFLETITTRYNIYLLSNTNCIHQAAFNKIFTEQIGKPSMDVYFIKSYYSHHIGLRKPYTKIYEFVLQDADILAEETLFIDDSIINIEPAKNVGIHTHLLLPHQRIEALNL